jgi:hypothetical protein
MTPLQHYEAERQRLGLDLPDDPQFGAEEFLHGDYPEVPAAEDDPILTGTEVLFLVFLACLFVLTCALVAWLKSGMTLGGLWESVRGCLGW